jgi:hypothetical protein
MVAAVSSAVRDGGLNASLDEAVNFSHDSTT